MKSTTEEASTDSAMNQEKLAENKAKQVEAKKVTEKMKPKSYCDFEKTIPKPSLHRWK